MRHSLLFVLLTVIAAPAFPEQPVNASLSRGGTAPGFPGAFNASFNRRA